MSRVGSYVHKEGFDAVCFTLSFANYYWVDLHMKYMVRFLNRVGVIKKIPETISCSTDTFSLVWMLFFDAAHYKPSNMNKYGTTMNSFFKSVSR